MRKNHAAFLAAPALVLAAALLVACGGGGGGSSSPPPPPPRTVPDNLVVNPGTGLDNNDGIAAPVATIGQALVLAIPGDNVIVMPGTYDVGTSPLRVPAGVTLIGSEADNGASTVITGGGYAVTDNNGIAYAATLVSNANITVAGFTITNGLDNSVNRIGVLSEADNVTIRNCRIVNNSYAGIANRTVSDNLVVLNCRIANNGYAGIAVYGGAGHRFSGNLVDNNYVGIGFVSGAGATTRIEYNTITGNSFGVEFDSPGSYGDLGGGTTNSAGGNVLAHNTEADLYTNFAPGGTISAKNNFWDHLPGNILFLGNYLGGGFDIVDVYGATMVTDNAALYTP
jgi:parallel beta-helix repeat protein